MVAAAQPAAAHLGKPLPEQTRRSGASSRSKIELPPEVDHAISAAEAHGTQLEKKLSAMNGLPGSVLRNLRRMIADLRPAFGARLASGGAQNHVTAKVEGDNLDIDIYAEGAERVNLLAPPDSLGLIRSTDQWEESILRHTKKKWRQFTSYDRLQENRQTGGIIAPAGSWVVKVERDPLYPTRGKAARHGCLLLPGKDGSVPFVKIRIPPKVAEQLADVSEDYR
jgi:hypothetical protein